jgi:transcriptional regulator with GAF, ATPase, and Fis domain
LPAARCIANYIALAVSHAQLAQAEQRRSEAELALQERPRNEVEVAPPLVAKQAASRSGSRPIIGQSRAWQRVLCQVDQVAPTDATVLLQGESGTGKELIARLIHRKSPRQVGPFVAVNCAALPDSLLESELFGYERGAFTGAQQTKPGQIELASGGVLLLDEVSEMSPLAQAKFLRVLQERAYQRLGGTRLLTADIRIIAASNRDLWQAVTNKTFREDLYYRLKVFDIELPPLRERTDDIPRLTDALIAELGHELGRPISGVSHEARAMLQSHDWPGNVRELRNVLERALILSAGGLLTREHIALQQSAPRLRSLPIDLNAIERRRIEDTLMETDWNVAKTAKRLGLTRTQLYVRLRKYQLERPAA